MSTRRVVVACVALGLALWSTDARDPQGQDEAGAAWASPRRPGRVVRVERPRVVRAPELRLCPMPFTDQQKGICYGGGPAVGDTAALFDFDQNHLGRLRVTTVQPSQIDPCSAGSTFEFTYELMGDADPAPAMRIPFAIAVFGLELDPARTQLIMDGSKLPVPDAVARAQPWMGLDIDGDDTADVMVTAFECPDLAPAPPGGGSAEAFCLDYWLRSTGGWTHVRRDYLYTCV